MEHEYITYLEDIINAVDDIFLFVENMDFDQFMLDKKTYFAVIQRFSTIGEAVKHIPCDEKERYLSVPWKSISNMRNNLIHEYFNIESEIIWKTIHKDLSVFKSQVHEILINGNRSALLKNISKKLIF